MNKKQKPALKLSFIRGEPNRFVIESSLDTPNMFERIDAYKFAFDFCDNDLTSEEEKLFLCAFFANVKQILEKRKHERQLAKVHIYLNGMVACFNHKGEQMPELQGEWESCKQEISRRDSRIAAFDRNAEGVKYFYGAFGGEMVNIGYEGARNLKF